LARRRAVTLIRFVSSHMAGLDVESDDDDEHTHGAALSPSAKRSILRDISPHMVRQIGKLHVLTSYWIDPDDLFLL
jgi:hypothetical protein